MDPKVKAVTAAVPSSSPSIPTAETRNLMQQLATKLGNSEAAAILYQLFVPREEYDALKKEFDKLKGRIDVLEAHEQAKQAEEQQQMAAMSQMFTQLGLLPNPSDSTIAGRSAVPLSIPTSLMGGRGSLAAYPSAIGFSASGPPPGSSHLEEQQGNSDLYETEAEKPADGASTTKNEPPKDKPEEDDDIYN